MGHARKKDRETELVEGDKPEHGSSDDHKQGDSAGGGSPGSEGARWVKPEPLGRFGKSVLTAVVLAVNLPVIHYFFLRPTPATSTTVPFHDDFSDPATVSKHYFSTGGHWRTVGGELLSPGVKNNPLWLKASLPQDAVVEFDVRSESPAGDIKVEIFGDGSDHASGYVLIHGGWNNSLSIIARRDEHGLSLEKLRSEAQRVARQRQLPSADLVQTGVFRPDTRMRVEANPFPVQQGRKYHWRIERRGALLRWSIDGQLFMQFDDPFPLSGKRHDRFGFSSWESQLYFDNLSIAPL